MSRALDLTGEGGSHDLVGPGHVALHVVTLGGFNVAPFLVARSRSHRKSSQ